MEQLEVRTVPSTLTVLNILDSGAGSLRDTIKHADSGDTIMFASSLHGQTITLTKGELEISQSLDIEGPGAGLLAVSGNNHSRVFNVSQDQDKNTVAVTIAGLTIEDGLASNGVGGGILNKGGTLTLNNDLLCNNQAVGRSTIDEAAVGGAIANKFGGTLTVSGCWFSGNQALGSETGNAFGGAIDNNGAWFGATATITNSHFIDNLARGGDGGNAPNGDAFNGLGLGGALMNDNRGTLSVSGCTFTGNEALGGSNIAGSATDRRLGNGNGGALLNVAVATVTDSTFTGNKAQGGSNNTGGPSVQYMGNGIGGGIATNVFPGGGFPQSLTVTDCTFTNNQAVGGADNVGGVVTGLGFGGGLAAYLGATVTVVNGVFYGNHAFGSDGADGLGGGIANFAGSTLILSGCTLSGNDATGGAGGGHGFGGGVYNDGTSGLTISSSTISSNHATGGTFGYGEGGGLYVASDGIVYLDAFTVSRTTGNTPDDIYGSYILI